MTSQSRRRAKTRGRLHVLVRQRTYFLEHIKVLTLFLVHILSANLSERSSRQTSPLAVLFSSVRLG